MVIEVREETSADIAAIREINHRAFGQPQEGVLVDALRSNGAARLSLVAVVDGALVGHIMYSPITIAGAVYGAALGPMAVLPEHQSKGVGSALVRSGTDRLRTEGCPFIIVLGHADFYPRFGFQPSSAYGVTCEWDVPDEAFMLLVLDEARMQDVSGMAKYRDEFAAVI